MHHFPNKRRKPFSLPTVRPTYADVLCGLLDDPEFDWLMTDPGHVESGSVLPAGQGSAPLHSFGARMFPGQHRQKEAHVARRLRASRRLVFWLEAVDPLFGATINMLFDVTGSWPPRLERSFWKTLEGRPLRFMDVYAEVRDIVDSLASAPAWGQ